jgi:excinuclease ABC subunit B
VEYNAVHHIAPKSITKSIEEVLAATAVADVKAARDQRRERAKMPKVAEAVVRYLTADQRKDLLEELNEEMKKAARDLEFERAAELRDEIQKLEALPPPGAETKHPPRN